jgi:hypothetical protein
MDYVIHAKGAIICLKELVIPVILVALLVMTLLHA